MRPADEHLTPQEIEKLLFEVEGSNDNASGAVALEAQQHLSGCAVCQSVADKYRKADSELRSLETSKQGSRQPVRGTECPADDAWVRLAAGLTDDAESKRCVTHAATCDWCGPRLKEAMEDLAQDVTAHEQQALASLRVSSEAWQRQMADRLAEIAGAPAKAKDLSGVEEKRGATPGEKLFTMQAEKRTAEKHQGFSWWPKLAWAGAAVVIVAAGWFIWLKTREPDVNQLLAQAYTEQRTIELRMPGAEYGPMRVERGGERSRLAKPTALLDAEALIAHRLAKDPESASILQMRGRAELIEWNYDASIETFKHGLDLDADSLTLKIDLASAYFERAEASDQAIDYGQSIELLGEVLAKKPDDPVALFNRAIAYEQMFLYHKAVEDWEHYLSVDRSGPWSEEARGRLLKTKRKLEEHERKTGELLFLPGAFIRHVNTEDESSWEVAESRIEEYLELAMRRWLPTTLPNVGLQVSRKDRVEARLALHILARILQQRHQDYWLLEINESPRSQLWTSAFESLQNAIDNNQAGDADAAATLSRRAAMLFRRLNNSAGYARSQLELVYALHRSSQGTKCLGALAPLTLVVDRHRYSWIKGQMEIENSICANISGDVGKSQNYLDSAFASTQRFHYPTLYLRALALSATYAWFLKASPRGTWSQDRRGLQLYWEGAYPPLRAYNFYQDLTFSAEKARDVQLVYSLRSEADTIDGEMHDETRHAIAHFLLAKAAAVAGKRQEAEIAFRAARNAFEQLSQTDSIVAYRLFCDIQLAQLKAQQGLVDDGLKLLEPREKDLERLVNAPIRADFYNGLGELNRRASRNQEAERAFRSAIAVAETGVASLPNEVNRLAWEKAVGDAYRGLVRLKIGYHPEDALDIWESYRSLASDAFMALNRGITKQNDGEIAALAPTSIRESRASFTQDTVVSYAVLPDGISIWTYDDTAVHSVFVPVAQEVLEHVVARFVEQCSNPSSDMGSLQLNGARLYAWLVAPIESTLNHSRSLIIEPDGVLNEIPMSALVDGEGRFLGTQFALTYSPGLGPYRKLRHQDDVESDAAVLVVAPGSALSKDSVQLRPIPQAGSEGEAVARRFRNARVLANRDANWNAIRDALSNATIFHFAGHAVAKSNQTGLLLAKGDADSERFLTADDLARADISNIQVAVLSACSTGKPEVDGSPEFNNLVQVFLRSRVPHVVATRWNVDSAVTAEFVNVFYEALLQHQPVAKALQAAAKRTKGLPSFEHPYYWAAFSSFGRS